ncbi:MAG: hypothetical protein LCH57_14790, partial [Proteobacteria bacterium]|nr:hypothetical protein [Pseudomonadota bacterium]
MRRRSRLDLGSFASADKVLVEAAILIVWIAPWLRDADCAEEVASVACCLEHRNDSCRVRSAGDDRA